MNASERARFDAILERVIDELPPRIRALIEEVPVIVLDRPSPELLGELGIPESDVAAAEELCGLHSGTSLTDRTHSDAAEIPNDIHLFREGIINLAGGWSASGDDSGVEEEILITLLHEIGHQFGLDEDDLERLGYD